MLPNLVLGISFGRYYVHQWVWHLQYCVHTQCVAKHIHAAHYGTGKNCSQVQKCRVN